MSKGKKKNKKSIIIGAVAAVVLLAAAAIGVFFIQKNRKSQNAPVADGSEIYAVRISDIMGLNASDLGLNQRFSGIVEPQKTIEIQLESGRTTSEIFVEVDDAIKAGDPLFQYDTDEVLMKIEQGKLELEKIENSIITQQQQIEELKEQAEDAWGDTLLQYTIQIQEAEVNLKQTEYDRDVKKMEIEKNQKSIDQAIVVSPIDGIIRSINENQSQNNDYYGGNTNNNSFMTIIADGQYRIKGLINEQNVYQISVGTPVTIRSRVDENQTWTGMIEEIDTANPENSQNQNYYYEGGDPMLQTSKYPFYVQLDSYDGLLMGQHVYIEMGGEIMEPAHTEGVWLWDGYFFYDDDDPVQAYCWVVKNGKISKRKVTVGEIDPETGMYQVTDGLSQDDAIAWPDESVTEGAPAIIAQ
ncbi:MAG: HlyD family efflux transporter periplasmic adaptor subunit [Firmicutes bacterium]|nr:HlyD family efflux transporter periplasmic adaptor subunit [Bacillota bacterium]